MTTKPCSVCGGKGNDGYHKTEPCGICKGTGNVEIVDEPIVEEEIPEEEREVKKPKRRGR